MKGPHSHECRHARPSQRPPDGDWLVWLFSGGRGTGKLLALDTPVPTPFGWATMGQLKVGDVVFDEQGRMCNVEAVYDEMPERAYRLTFSDGTSIEAGGEHQWVTWTHSDRKTYLRSGGITLPDNWPTWKSSSGRGPQIRTTDEIVASVTYGKRNDTNHSVPVAGPLQMPEAQLPIDPYLLGLWLGDGSSATSEITCHDDDASFYAEQCAALGEGWEFARRRHVDKPTATYTLGKRLSQRGTDGRMEGNGSITSRLRSLGILGEKSVPRQYLWASAEQRLALLQGLMDTDGGWSGTTVEFCNTNPQLAQSVVLLARSLGQKPVVKESRATLYGKDCGPKWRVTWRPTVQVFRLPRKAERFQYGGPQASRHVHRMISKVEAIPVKPMRCITVDGPNSMYLAGEAMVPTHNTRAGAEWVLDQVWNQGKKRIALVARTPADARDVMIYGDSGIMAVSAPHERPAHEPTKRRLIWPNGAQAFTYSAAAPAQLRGPQHDAAWCVAQGELVETARGQVPIEHVRVDDYVWTREGLRRVTASTLTNANAEIMEIHASSGHVLRCTPNHRVWANGDWKLAQDVAPSDTLIAWTSSAGLQRGLSGTEVAGLFSETATTKTGRGVCCTSSCGNESPDADCQMGSSSITSITTSRTMSQATSSACPDPSTAPTTTQHETIRSLRKQHGTLPTPSGLSDSPETVSASSAPSSISRSVCELDSVRESAATNIYVVGVLRNGERGAVYDLTVESAHEFYASGLLVHNCDETAAWLDARKGDVLDTSWNNLMLGLRLGQQPQCFVTTTPKRVRLIREIMERKSTAITTDTTYANLKNLAASFQEQVVQAYEGTRIGRQELMGEMLTDVDGALWQLDNIDGLRVELG